MNKFGTWMVMTALLAAGSFAHAASSGNLLVGSDGEAGNCTTDWHAVTTVPGWNVAQGNPAIVCYSIGSFGTPSSPAPGKAFLADGPYGDSALQQQVDVSAAHAAIDGGTVGYTLSGWLGGWTTYAGQAQVSATFLDASGHALGSPAQIGGVTAAARNYQTKFIAKSATGNVPTGTRTISVLLQFTNTSGSYNVGYADNLSLTLTTPVTAATLAPPPSAVPAFDHVFIVIMENTDYAAVIGDTTNAPFINSLVSQGTLLSNASGVYHPSDENYLAIAGGDTFVQGAIYYPNIHVSAQHIGDELEALGKTWKAYEQGMGPPCNTSNNFDSYYQPDDAPFINFTNIASNTARCQAHLFDATQLTTDLASAATTPNFSWIAADDYYDGEASGNGSAASVKVQDGWLRQTLQPVFASPAWTSQRSLLILTWDESASSGTNHVATILVGSQGLVRTGAIGSQSYNHYSIGRTIENALGIGALTPNDNYALPINEAFIATPPPPSATLSTTTSSVVRGASINFSYTTPPATLSSSNWIGIYPAGVTPGSQSSISWSYAANSSGATTFATSSLSAGNYAAWYCYNDGYTVLAGPVPFTVTP